ncbi:MAG: hypothetical protein CMM03_17055 [Rhodopirellula sp.]|nr:hypothetical protein [Rhodopirellula sp.]
MSLYGRVDSTANQTQVGLTRGNGAGSATETIVFVDETEAGLAANKERGITAPGWWAYRTYTDGAGNTRHKAEHLMVLTNPEANADETLSDDTIAADVAVTISITQQPTQNANPVSIAVGAGTTVPMSAIATPPGDASVLTFQWQKKSGRRWSNVSGQTHASLSFTSYAAADAGDYRCKINSTNGGAEVISNVLTVQTA